MLSHPLGIDCSASGQTLAEALREVCNVLRKHSVSARVILDCDPDYGPYIAVETELRASEVLDL